MEAQCRSGSEKISNSFLDFNEMLESIERDEYEIFTDLDCINAEHSWTCFSTDNLCTSQELPAQPDIEVPAAIIENPSELVESQQAYNVFGWSPQGSKSSGDQMLKGEYSTETLIKANEGWVESRQSAGSSDQWRTLIFENTENLNEEDKGSAKSSQSAHYSHQCRALISDKRRRGRMNERLYALRSLVPKITKMDKASILEDAVSYVQDLQKQMKDIQTEISQLESDLMNKDCPFVDRNSAVTNVDLESVTNEMSSTSSSLYKPGRKIILELTVAKVGESMFHIRISCKKGPGVLIDLTKALESLHLGFKSASLMLFDGQIVKTATIKMKKFGAEMDSEGVKQIILEAAANYGFEVAFNIS